MENENKKYEGFTLSLALVDALPVLFFGGSSILIGLLFGSPLFIVGASLIFLGGFLKVMWKVILAVKNKDISILNKQMKYTMLTGFGVVVASVIANIKRIDLKKIGKAIVSLPLLPFIIVYFLGMTAMGILGKKMDSTKVRSNWIEQCVNGFSQLALFVGLLLLVFKGRKSEE